VQLPPFETFCDAESHAAVLAHELTDATNIASARRTTWPQAFWRQRFGEGGISCGARRAQAMPAAVQPAPFTLREDHRPTGERGAAERYSEPSLFAVLEQSR
jgi:hypothetical protein